MSENQMDHLFSGEDDPAKVPAEAGPCDAMRDPLTGLYNQDAFDLLLKDSDQAHIAILVAEIDDFNILQQQHGEEVGGRAVQLAADMLRASFRPVDSVCRIRRSGFAVIMARVNSSLSKLVSDKMRQINDKLQNHGVSLPPLSLSVGVAFSDRQNPHEDIYRDANTALLRMREQQRRGCAIY